MSWQHFRREYSIAYTFDYTSDAYIRAEVSVSSVGPFFLLREDIETGKLYNRANYHLLGALLTELRHARQTMGIALDAKELFFSLMVRTVPHGPFYPYEPAVEAFAESYYTEYLTYVMVDEIKANQMYTRIHPFATRFHDIAY